MSYCRKEGKDTIIFATEEFLSTPSTETLAPDNKSDIDTSNASAILPNGEINWDCPCLGNLPSGPCGPAFKEAFSCWVENRDHEENFANNCFENFSTWEHCLAENKDIYKPSDDEEKGDTDTKTDNYVKSENDDQTKQIESSEPSPAITHDSNRAIAAASIKK